MWKQLCSVLCAGVMFLSSTPVYAANDKGPPSDVSSAVVAAEEPMAEFSAERKSLSLNRSGLTAVSGYDFVMDVKKMQISNMQIITADSGWHLRKVASNRHYLSKDFPNGVSGQHKYSGKIQIKFKDAVKDGANNRYDLSLTMDNIMFDSLKTVHEYDIMDFYTNHERPVWVLSSYPTGTRVRINYQVLARGTDNPVPGKLLLTFTDLDQPGFPKPGTDKRAYGDMSNYTESIRLDSGVMSDVYVEPNHVLKIQNGNREFIATKDTLGREAEALSGVAFLGDARGTRVTFMITGAGTSLTPTNTDSFQTHTATTYVRYQNRDGLWGDYRVVNQQTLTSGMSYWYTWTHDTAGVSPKVYGTPSKTTVGVNALTSNKDFHISVPRNKWTHSFKSNAPANESVNGMPNSVTKYAENPIGKVKSPTMANYDFTGWNTAANGKGSKFSSDAPMLSNQTWYAQWAPKTYTLTYDKNSPPTASVGDSDVKLSKSSQTAAYDKTWGELATASKPGYVFDGWWTAESGGNRISSSTKVKGNMTAYAHWKPIEYTVRFHPNAENGMGTVTGEMPSIKMTYDKVMTLPLNQYSKTTVTPPEDDGGTAVTNDSVFKGWNRNPKALDVGYADGAKVMNLTQSNNGFIDLYAIWDDAPNFVIAEYPDRFFTLEDAQSGKITEERLLETVRVYDRETTELPKKTSQDVVNGNDTGVTIVGYDANEWKSLTDDSVVSVRYQVKDDAGHKTYLNISVTVTRNGALPKESVEYFRAISSDYRSGLADISRWNTDAMYSSKLNDALTGSAKTHELYLGPDSLKTVRSYVQDNGYGNSRDSGMLSRLFDELFK